MSRERDNLGRSLCDQHACGVLDRLDGVWSCNPGIKLVPLSTPAFCIPEVNAWEIKYNGLEHMNCFCHCLCLSMMGNLIARVDEKFQDGE